ncbi:MAG: hypothetical protein ABI760_18285 [Ferruginibacter sp.]
MKNQDYLDADDQKAGPSIRNEEFGEVSSEGTVDNDITPVELKLLDDAGVNESADDDDQLLDEALLDDTDDEGDKLNEEIDLTGEDLDIPGSEADDDDESIGEGDEENNIYSSSRQHDDNDTDL